jgi:hypothetical protein
MDPLGVPRDLQAALFVSVNWLGSPGSDTVLVCGRDLSWSAADTGKGDYLRLWR